MGRNLTLPLAVVLLIAGLGLLYWQLVVVDESRARVVVGALIMVSPAAAG